MNRNSLTALAALLLMTVPLPAAAQVDLAEGPSDEPSDELALGEGSAEGDVEFSEDEEEAFDDDGEEGASDEGGAEGEEEGPAKLLLGARYRLMVVPEFVFDMVGVDGGRSMWIQGGGPEIGFAHDHFELLGSVWFAGYSLESTPFKSKGDSAAAWELVQSSLATAYVSADFLWKQPVADKWDLLVGLGLGVGVVFGGFEHTDAYWTDNYGNPTLPSYTGNPYTNLQPCVGPGVPTAVGGQCPPGGDYRAGGAPPVFPWLTFQTGVRYAPVRNFIVRLDLGVGSSGFWFGLGADYGI